LPQEGPDERAGIDRGPTGLERTYQGKGRAKMIFLWLILWMVAGFFISYKTKSKAMIIGGGFFISFFIVTAYSVGIEQKREAAYRAEMAVKAEIEAKRQVELQMELAEKKKIEEEKRKKEREEKRLERLIEIEKEKRKASQDIAIFKAKVFEILKDQRIDIVKDIYLNPDLPQEAIIVMKPIWHSRNKHLKKNDATVFWKLWASQHSPSDPDHSRVKLLSINNDRVGGSRILAGSLIWVED